MSIIDVAMLVGSHVIVAISFYEMGRTDELLDRPFWWSFRKRNRP